MSNQLTEFSPPRPGLLDWYKDINNHQWRTFLAAFLGWALDAMDLLLFAFAVEEIAIIFNLSPVFTWKCPAVSDCQKLFRLLWRNPVK